MHTKTKRWGLLAVALVAASGIVAGTNASASHPEVSLPGSDFEIDTDANLRLDDPAPSEDWASIPQGDTAGTERRKADLPSGGGDDSFGQGTKEDTPVPSVVDGSIPPNKSDLLTFGGYLETNDAGDRFLNIYWHRVQEPQGTTNMDFEFNKSSVISANGVTPVRTAGDALIQYDLSQGGTNPQLFLSALGDHRSRQPVRGEQLDAMLEHQGQPDDGWSGDRLDQHVGHPGCRIRWPRGDLATDVR